MFEGVLHKDKFSYAGNKSYFLFSTYLAFLLNEVFSSMIVICCMHGTLVFLTDVIHSVILVHYFPTVAWGKNTEAKNLPEVIPQGKERIRTENFWLRVEF